MEIPKIVYSDKTLDKLSIFKRIGGITLWPWIILRERYKDHYNTPTVINHESIHIKQQQEMLVIFFYLWYGIEWFIKLFKYGKQAYYNISFEQEAYTYENDLKYINNRKMWAWKKYL